MKWFAMCGVVVVAAGAFVLFGCHEKKVVVVRESPPDRVVVVQREPAPVVVEERPPEVVVEEPPPPVRVEVIPVRPSVDVVWIGGYWYWRDRHYVWYGGHWGRPPHHGAVWEHDRWERSGHGYHYRPGHWR